jgi:hypothetical protein
VRWRFPYQLRRGNIDLVMFMEFKNRNLLKLAVEFDLDDSLVRPLPYTHLCKLAASLFRRARWWPS